MSANLKPLPPSLASANIGPWGHPSPPKTCRRLKWMVPYIIDLTNKSEFFNLVILPSCHNCRKKLLSLSFKNQEIKISWCSINTLKRSAEKIVSSKRMQTIMGQNLSEPAL